jgi:hypothetical protein
MNKLYKLFVTLIAFGLASSLAIADQTDLPVKWSQPPNMATGSVWNSMSGHFICADDFLCENPLPVNDVHWWGSYWAGQNPRPINGFTIKFFSDDTDDFSHPDQLLYQAYIPGNCSETLYGFYPPDLMNVYQYNCILPEPFHQTPGTVYWLSVQVDPGWNPEPYWGWSESTAIWNDCAVLSSDTSPLNWGKINVDLAFELSVVPEPSTVIMLLCACVMALAASVWRRR